MSWEKLRREFRALLDERADAEEQRFVDLCVVWKRAKTDETLWVAGGQWDRIEERYTGRDPEDGKVILLRESQIESARWAAWWMQERAAGRPRDFFGLFMLSDRGAGKTHFGSVLMGTMPIQFPRFDGQPTIGWMVSSSHSDREELDREIAANFPSEWFRYVEWPKHEYRWINGCKLTHLSAAKLDSLKKGRVDFLLVNEPQKMTKRAPAFALGRIKDKGGLATFAGNPPTELKAKWILDWEEKDRERRNTPKPYPIRFVKLDSRLNDTLDAAVADQVAEVIRDLDPRLAQADIDGLLLRPGQPAYWEWVKQKHIKPPPNLGDVTRAVLQKRTGRAYDYLAGADFQATPHMAAVVYKLYGSVDNPIPWAVQEFVVEQATEDDLLNEVDEAGYTPESVLWVGDGSGQWQDGKHNKHGRDSFSVFKARRWHIVPPVKPKTPDQRPRNPPVEQRVKLMNRLLAEESLQVAPECTKLAEAFKECELQMGRYGKVVPLGFYAHLTDAASYPIWWLFPKPRAPGVPGPVHRVVDLGPRQNWI